MKEGRKERRNDRLFPTLQCVVTDILHLSLLSLPPPSTYLPPSLTLGRRPQQPHHLRPRHPHHAHPLPPRALPHLCRSSRATSHQPVPRLPPRRCEYWYVCVSVCLSLLPSLPPSLPPSPCCKPLDHLFESMCSISFFFLSFFLSLSLPHSHPPGNTHTHLALPPSLPPSLVVVRARPLNMGREYLFVQRSKEPGTNQWALPGGRYGGREGGVGGLSE